MPEPFTHRPVMVDEIVAVFASVPAGVVLDATLGGGGHSEALLESRPDLSIMGVDRDPAALAAATARLERFGDRFRAVHARFDEIDGDATATRLAAPCSTSACPRRSSTAPSAASPTARTARSTCAWTPTAPWSAADVVNGYDVDELARVIRRYGDERFAGRIARAIVAARPIETTVELATIVSGSHPRGGPPHRRPPGDAHVPGHPHRGQRRARRPARRRSTRRSRRMAPGGRIAVLSYHSGEDRIVKDRLRRATGACDCPPDLPCVCGAVQTVRLVRGVPKRPSVGRARRQPACRVGAPAGRRAGASDDGRDAGQEGGSAAPALVGCAPDADADDRHRPSDLRSCPSFPSRASR